MSETLEVQHHRRYQYRMRAQALSWALLGAIALALASWVCFAQGIDAGVLEPTPVDAVLAPAAQSAQHFINGNILAGLFTLALALGQALKFFGSKLPGKVGEAFASPIALWVLPMVVAILGSIVTALATGQPFTLALLLTAVASGFGAGGTFSRATIIADAVKKGEVAAVKVATPEAAVDALSKGGAA
jgi:MFS family permease